MADCTINQSLCNLSPVTGPPRQRPLRVYAGGDPRSHTWQFEISDTAHNVIAWQLAVLPPGYPWTEAVATHYALAQAARHVAAHLPDARVLMVCTQPRRRQGREARRWAA